MPAAKRFPVNNLGAEVPEMIAVDHRGMELRFGAKERDCYILMTSLECPVCHTLHFGLGRHAGILKEREPMYLLTRSNLERMQQGLEPGEFPILNHAPLFLFLGDKTMPVLFSLRQGRLVGAHIVNTIDHVISVVSPEHLA